MTQKSVESIPKRRYRQRPGGQTDGLCW